MGTKEIAIIKLGGSIITDKSKPYTPNTKALKRLSEEIYKSGRKVLIVHGQGSFAHTSAKKYGGKKGYKSRLGISEVLKDSMEMNIIVMRELFKIGLPVISFRPNSLFLASGGKLKKNNLEVVEQALLQGLVPVLYGDVIMDTQWKTTIFSGETSTRFLISYLLKKSIRVSKVVQVGITDGVYDEKGKTISSLSASEFKKLGKNIFGSKSTDVTGGMRHKVEEALNTAKMGVPTLIISGLRKNQLLEVLTGKNSRYQTLIS